MKKILIPIIAGSVLASQAFADKPEWVEKKNAEKHEMHELKKAEKHEMKEYKKSEKHHDDESRRHEKEHHGYDQDRSKGNEENEASNEDTGNTRESQTPEPIEQLDRGIQKSQEVREEVRKWWKFWEGN